MRGLNRDEIIVLGLIVSIILGIILYSVNPRTDAKAVTLKIAVNRSLEQARKELAEYSANPDFPNQESAKIILSSPESKYLLPPALDIYYASSPIEKDSQETLLAVKFGARSLIVPASGPIQWHDNEIQMSGLSHLMLTGTHELNDQSLR